MADKYPGIFIPQPIYHLSQDIAEALKTEILKEKEKSSQLAKQLEIERYKNQQFEQYFITISSPSLLSHLISYSQENLLRSTGSLSSFASMPDLISHDFPRPYSPKTRSIKIAKYKNKIKASRKRVQVSRNFLGRSKVAKGKPRLNGKFVKANSCESLI